MKLYMNDEGKLEEYKEEEYVDVPLKDMELIQGYIEKNKEDFASYCKSIGREE